MVNSENRSNGTYNELEIQDDDAADPLFSKMTRFTFRDVLSSGSYRLAVIFLGVLSAAFLFVVIGLSVHINRIGDKHDILSLNSSIISSQLAQLQSDHRNLTESKNALQNKHDEDVNLIKSLQIDLSRETKLKNELISQKQKLEEDKKKMQSQISNLEGNCGKCLPNWVLMNSTCLYFAMSLRTRGWRESRDDCKNRGADLVIIDSKEKQEFIVESLSHWYNLQFSYRNGFWIGLKEDHTEGIWKWLNETTLTEGHDPAAVIKEISGSKEVCSAEMGKAKAVGEYQRYWMEGEPNDYEVREDCVAVYPSKNPVQAWNDAPCLHQLNWICEKEID